MNLKIILDDGAIMPTRAHAHDAGLDLYAQEGRIIEAKESAIFDTGVHVLIPEGYVGLLMSKSGLNVKYGLTSEGVIDASYTGSIVVKLYNNSGFDYHVNSGFDYHVRTGDKISQLLIMPIETPSLIQVNDFAEKTERGSNGFGSSGR